MSNLRKILSNKISCKSIWFMRQAGRYLPEFRNIRQKNPNFIKLCLDSELCTEITLQPIKRFNLDSAIIFSDILMIPYALGQNVNFIKDNGPKLSKFNLKDFAANNEGKLTEKLDPVYKAIDITRKKLNKEKSLISFVGAPWTLLIYMFDLKKNKEEIDFNKFNNGYKSLKEITEELTYYLCIHIKNQINAGADVVQIFDSWAGLLPINNVKEFCYIPNKKIIEFCKKKKIANICFPKGLQKNYKDFVKLVKPDGVNIDFDINPQWAKENLKNVVIQGGMSPKALLDTEGKMLSEATKYIEAFKDIPYVFNLGHGLLPETDPDKVGKLVNFYRKF